MVHTRSQGHPLSGSGEEDFKGFFLTYMGVAAILAMSPGLFEQLRSLHMKFEFNLPSGFR